MAIDPGNPRRFLRSIKWKKAMEGFFHRQIAYPPPHHARLAAAAEAASQQGNCPAGGSFTTRADRIPGQASTAARASADGS